jgi:hypothetical protein
MQVHNHPVYVNETLEGEFDIILFTGHVRGYLRLWC